MYCSHVIVDWLKALPVILLLVGQYAAGVSQNVVLDFETGLFYFAHNEVAVTNVEGTRFAMTDLIKREPAPYVRIRLGTTFGSRDQHHVRLLYAPLEKTGSGSLANETRFLSAVFRPDATTRGTYRFTTYRLTYRYTLVQGERLTFGVGATALFRDARIEVSQDGVTKTDADFGVVPLLHLRADYQFSERHSLAFDVESLAAPSGRATDLELSWNHALKERIRVRAGYRLIEGGVNVPSVYNFTLIHFMQAGVTFAL